LELAIWTRYYNSSAQNAKIFLDDSIRDLYELSEVITSLGTLEGEVEDLSLAWTSESLARDAEIERDQESR